MISEMICQQVDWSSVMPLLMVQCVSLFLPSWCLTVLPGILLSLCDLGSSTSPICRLRRSGAQVQETIQKTMFSRLKQDERVRDQSLVIRDQWPMHSYAFLCSSPQTPQTALEPFRLSDFTVWFWHFELTRNRCQQFNWISEYQLNIKHLWHARIMQDCNLLRPLNVADLMNQNDKYLQVAVKVRSAQ